MKMLSKRELLKFRIEQAEYNWYNYPDDDVHPVYWEVSKVNTKYGEKNMLKVLDKQGQTYFSARASVIDSFLRIAEVMEDEEDFIVHLQLFTSKNGAGCARVVLR